MKPLRDLNAYRDRRRGRQTGHEGGDLSGVFYIPYPRSPTTVLQCIASIGEGWDHVSVSVGLPRTPSWSEMDFVKRAFFRPEEVAMQLHVAESDHISIHPYVLHLWRPHSADIPLPPKEFV